MCPFWILLLDVPYLITVVLPWHGIIHFLDEQVKLIKKMGNMYLTSVYQLSPPWNHLGILNKGHQECTLLPLLPLGSRGIFSLELS